MKVRIRLVVAGIWAASRAELTRYGRTPEEAFGRLTQAESERDMATVLRAFGGVGEIAREVLRMCGEEKDLEIAR
jgi:hypothetical protein